MTDGVGNKLADLRVAGFYLPSLLLLYVYLNNTWWLYLFLAGTSLLAGIIYHGMLRSVFGPSGPEENPLQKGEGHQRFVSIFLGGTPPRHLGKTILDVGLNGNAYWGLISRKRKIGCILGVGLLFMWPIGTLLAIVAMFPYFNSVRFTVLVIYFALIAWLLQEFMFWPKFPSIYLYEDHEKFGYVTKYESYDLREEDVKPERPANWMKLVDAQILHILRKKGIFCTPLLVAFYYVHTRLEGKGKINTLKVSYEALKIEKEIEERLEILSDHDLVQRHDPGLYKITVAGKSYLSGVLEPEKLEAE